MKQGEFVSARHQVWIKLSAISLVIGAGFFDLERGYGREDVIPGSRYTSGRAAALGDAYLPLGDSGADGLFYNPAVIGKFRKYQAEPMNMSLYANNAFTDTFNSNFYKVTSLSSYQGQLQLSGRFTGVGGALLPNFYMKGLAFGLLLNSQLGGQAGPGGTIRYRSLYQVVPAVGTGVRLAGGIVRLGYSLHWVSQASGDVTVNTANNPNVGYDQSLAAGTGFSHNLGAALTLPVTYLPALNVVVRNAGNTTYGGNTLIPLAKNPTGAPPTENMTIDASFSLAPKIGATSVFNFVLEQRDLANQSGVGLLGHLAVGGEISLSNKLFLRGGFGSGYPSAGIGLKKKTGEFNLTWYSEELGNSFLSQRDTRYMLHYAVRAF